MPRVLDRLELAIQKSAPRLFDFLRPGLDEATISRLTANLPGAFSEEAKRFWEWRNGIDLSAGLATHPTFPMTFGRGEFRLGSLEECLALYAEIQSHSNSDVADIEPRDLEQWFPVELSGRVAMELVEKPAPISPIVCTDVFSLDRFGRTISPSLSELLLWWAESLESGGLVWTPETSWQVDSKLIRPELLDWGLT